MIIFQPDRFLLAEQIKKYAPYIKGVVLDAGCGNFLRYKNYFNFEKYITLDVNPQNKPAILASAEKIPLDNSSIDSIVCMQVLGDIKNYGQALSEFYRVLKSGGHILLSEAFEVGMHDEPNDFWRFTEFAFRLLLEEAGFEIIAMDKRGGIFAVMAQIQIRYLIDRFDLYNKRWGVFVKPFLTAFGRFMIFLDNRDKSQAAKDHALGWCVLAKK